MQAVQCWARVIDDLQTDRGRQCCRAVGIGAMREAAFKPCVL